MDRIKITGGNKLNGIIPISGAKNAALPLMIASLLTDETLTLENMPHLADVELLTRILGNHGADYSVNGRREHQNGSYERTVHFNTKNIVDTTAPYELVAKMRASFWVIGPLLARAGEAIVSLPGGCSIGTRPVDLMLDSLTALGAKIDIENGYARATTSSGLVGAEFTFPKVSVGATHVALMAACLAKGDTIIHNAACEPEVVNLADCLNAMGAKIEGAGTPTIRIQGVTSLKGARVRVIPDRIETGTYAMAVAMAGGDVVLQNTRSDLLQSALDTLRQTGTEITDVENGIRVVRNGHGIEPVDITTDPFPGFPTDLQAQFMGLMTKAKGTSHITETIFENRFMHVQELARLGAKISLSGQTATVEGVERLKGAPVMATDLRASATLVIAGLVAEGETTVNRVYHLDRGFERLEEKLSNCGAEVSRISG
ncbi:UDP-N-acetylglucosamine 1-carboxyvinyltransferase [Pseudochrobactrum sp. sp1633]|uniref:UDP-N-acetylglucosamine 1-carboxyvinyltransferase n=1 Tax=Pseudochrobactrum sp. sp1633 TaxID=3036706 RepID=UPI0025A68713|nr:UDP-N-acetylglucosamine 1-carboxyvinyltransferase [Pseudochrobactrum sp. sp1633]MDM8346665.1 UDP-N-acetylglucosamine 1-carboxyvinyltransferase [Pseudochrobactrum sp. sp1633]HWD13957.1 UDP-N-acetylglucosamine 1-carboxyvinyltransferase [Pseudochrobactrum sp.]